MQGCLLDKILDMQGKYDELVQKGGQTYYPPFCPFWILLSQSEQNLRP